MASVASVKILVRNTESGVISLMEISDDDPVQVTRAALKEHHYEVIDDPNAALKRLQAEKRGERDDRPFQSVLGFPAASAHLRIR